MATNNGSKNTGTVALNVRTDGSTGARILTSAASPYSATAVGGNIPNNRNIANKRVSSLISLLVFHFILIFSLKFNCSVINNNFALHIKIEYETVAQGHTKKARRSNCFAYAPKKRI